MVSLSPVFNPPILKGIKVHPDNPFRFDFIMDVGAINNRPYTNEAIRLVKYFLASLTIPEKDGPRELGMSYRNLILTYAYGRYGQVLIKSMEDAAMLGIPFKGGIDLNSDKLNLQLQSTGQEIKFHIDPAMLEQLQNAPGFVPVIINIQPLESLAKFLESPK